MATPVDESMATERGNGELRNVKGSMTVTAEAEMTMKPVAYWTVAPETEAL